MVDRRIKAILSPIKPDFTFAWTEYQNRGDVEGRACEGSLAAHCCRLEEIAGIVAPKGHFPMSYAVGHRGALGHCDGVTALVLDSDDGADWRPGDWGITGIWKRSWSDGLEGKRKYHVVLPLVRPWVGDGDEWRHLALTVMGLLEGTWDHSMASPMMRLCYAATRRSRADARGEVVLSSTGWALDMHRVAELYPKPAKRPDTCAAVAAKREVLARDLMLAMESLGMLLPGEPSAGGWYPCRCYAEVSHGRRKHRRGVSAFTLTGKYKCFRGDCDSSTAGFRNWLSQSGWQRLFPSCSHARLASVCTVVPWGTSGGSGRGGPPADNAASAVKTASSKPGIVAVTTGAGKSRVLATLAAQEAGNVALSVPRHDLAQQVRAWVDAEATWDGERAKVLRGISKGGCKLAVLVDDLDRSGIGGRGQLCRVDICPHYGTCDARKPEGRGQVVVAMHQNVGNFRGHVVYDETPNFIEHRKVSLKAGEPDWRLLPANGVDYEYAWRCIAAGDYAAVAAMPEMPRPSVPSYRRLEASLRWSEKTRAEALSAASMSFAIWQVWQAWKPIDTEFRSSWAHVENDELHISWLTEAGERVRNGSATIVDATPDVQAFEALSGRAADVTRIACGDSAPVRRAVMPLSRVSADDLECQRGLMSRIVDALIPLAVGKVALFTYRSVLLRKGPWLTKAQQLGWLLGYFGNVRGSNVWNACDTYITIGDPWPNLGAIRSELSVLDSSRAIRDTPWAATSVSEVAVVVRAKTVAEAELAQTHGRARTPRRTSAALCIHVGRLVPAEWHGGPVELAEPPETLRPLPSAPSSVFRLLADQIGRHRAGVWLADRMGVRAVAAHRTVTRVCDRRAMPPEGWTVALTELARSRA